MTYSLKNLLGELELVERQELAQSFIPSTQKYGLQGVDHLCCGNFGRIEVLLVAAQKLSCPKLLETAQKQAVW